MDPAHSAFLFYLLAALTGVCAVAVVITQNIVRAAAWLLFTLAGTAGIFFLLGAQFVGATQLLVYVGGTLVLVVFGVMLTAQGPFISMRIGAGEWAIALVVGLLLYSVLAISLLDFKAPPFAESAPADREGPDVVPAVVLGQALLGLDKASPPGNLTGVPPDLGRARTPGPGDPNRPGGLPRTPMAYLLPFEIVSVHLLVVLIGAAYLARAKRRRPAAGPATPGGAP
jgi:NADH-quinone oxidoreductase subunit J